MIHNLKEGQKFKLILGHYPAVNTTLSSYKDFYNGLYYLEFSNGGGCVLYSNEEHEPFAYDDKENELSVCEFNNEMIAYATLNNKPIYRIGWGIEDFEPCNFSSVSCKYIFKFKKDKIDYIPLYLVDLGETLTYKEDTRSNSKIKEKEV